MRIIKVYNEIGNSNGWVFSLDGESGYTPFSLAYVRKMFEDYPDEQEWKLDIHCEGGDVEEGLAIYDYLRTSGKTLYANIDGMCHSMAVVLLLSAPKDNRTANRNAMSLIHKVSGGAFGTTDDVQDTADLMRELQNAILNIYAERTDIDFATAESIMNEEREHNMKEFLDWGFISKIIDYNTNTYKKFMKKNQKMSLMERTRAFLNKVSKNAKNYRFVTPEGEELFSTEAEDDTLEVGMKAEPDGVFTLEDGRVITIEGGEITKIDEFIEVEETKEEMAEHIEELEKEVAELEKELEVATENLKEAQALLNEYAKDTKSNYQPANRLQMPKNQPKKDYKAEKEAIKAKLNRKK